MAETTTQIWTIGQLLSWTQGFLSDKGVEDARLAAELLLASALGCGRVDLYTRFEQVPAAEQIDRFRELVREAAGHKPIAYLTGHREFYSLDFLVTPDVLVPRPETEILVEQAIAAVRGLDRAAHVLDIGTGSGCVAIAIAKLSSAVRMVATDISAAALAVAKRNAERNKVDDRITFLEADAADIASGYVPQGGFDVMVANPPYIAATDRDRLPVGIREFEPAIALFGGADGIDVIRRIAAGGRRLLAPGGRAFIEMADGQHERVAAVFGDAGWMIRGVLPDGAGVLRVLALERGP